MTLTTAEARVRLVKMRVAKDRPEVEAINSPQEWQAQKPQFEKSTGIGYRLFVREAERAVDRGPFHPHRPTC